eukprot:CAMPEP_0173059994 /NCGR_PEP_ID=MMETSP1102-20130122/2331_1 /TAXON_ID=49646 /ORGANISM="Geminigera sp., Strain Caron Lab Isolate" /LENGTH=39 /DNA_ID= /DNA_START= /DNA_END= /DNA_ORIENTATION=
MCSANTLMNIGQRALARPSIIPSTASRRALPTAFKRARV